MTVESEYAPAPGLLRLPMIAGAFFALTAVMAGAFGAHGLRNLVSERSLDVFHTAVSYQVYHGIALVLVTLLSGFGFPRRLLRWGSGFFLAGIVLFSGSLYALVLTNIHWIGPVTPMGGLCFMIGWALLLIAGVRRQAN